MARGTTQRSIRISDEIWEGAREVLAERGTTVSAEVVAHLTEIAGYKPAPRRQVTLTYDRPALTKPYPSPRRKHKKRGPMKTVLTQENCDHSEDKWRTIAHGTFCLCGKKIA